MIYIRLCRRVSNKNFFTRPISEINFFFFFGLNNKAYGAYVKWSKNKTWNFTKLLKSQIEILTFKKPIVKPLQKANQISRKLNMEYSRGKFRWKVSYSVDNLIKSTLSGMRQYLESESPLKMMKNAFYFTLKARFVLKIIKFLSWLFGHVEKQLD